MVADDPESFADLDGHISLPGQEGEGCSPGGGACSQQPQVPPQNNCGFWCKVGRALGITETDEEKKAAAEHRDWIKQHVRTKYGKAVDTNHMSDREVTNLFDMIQFGLAIGRIPVRNVGGGAATAANALKQAEKWLGPGYKEISPGVYRSAGGTRQFRITDSDLLDPRQGPHVHFESIGPDGRIIEENSHVGITDP
jgi:hypothetical protein